MAEVTQQQVVEYIKGISVLELSQLVKTLESELGVSAAAAMPVFAGAPAAGGAAAPAEEKTERVEPGCGLRASGFWAHIPHEVWRLEPTRSERRESPLAT